MKILKMILLLIVICVSLFLIKGSLEPEALIFLPIPMSILISSLLILIRSDLSRLVPKRTHFILPVINFLIIFIFISIIDSSISSSIIGPQYIVIIFVLISISCFIPTFTYYSILNKSS